MIQGKCVLTHQLNKIYTSHRGPIHALSGLSLTMHENQITVILGHNGAGKTTLMSILTGLIPPTSGKAFVLGHSCVNDMSSVRASLGFCPQHDILFPSFTVREHFEIFARIKGIPPELITKESEEMAKRVGLAQKLDVQSKNLSGGMKRKLHLGLAFLGDSKFVVLDEPTSGMDPYSRRFTWSIIESYKEHRIVLLSTHYMDEADLLGDRIAILSQGKILCAGSGLFLKRAFGVGYQLTIEFETGKGNTTSVTNHTPPLGSNEGIERPGKHNCIIGKYNHESDI